MMPVSLCLYQLEKKLFLWSKGENVLEVNVNIYVVLKTDVFLWRVKPKERVIKEISVKTQ